MNRGAILAWGLILTVSWVVVGQAAPEDDLDRQLDRAGAALQAGRPVEAEREFRGLIEAYPGMAEAYDGLASALLAQGRDDEAVAVLIEVGTGLVRAEQVEVGTAHLKRAVEVAPDSASAHAALGYASLAGYAFVPAEQHLRRALALGESSAVVRLYLGAALWESARYDEAEEVYRGLIGSGGEAAAAARQSLGALLLFRGSFAESLGYLEPAAAASPGSPVVQYDLARALDGVGRSEDAIRAYRKVISLAPDHSHAQYRLALLLGKTGDRVAAQRELARFQELLVAAQESTHKEGLHRAKLLHGWDLVREGKLQEAIRHFSGLQESPDTLGALATVLTMAGDDPAAVRALERAVLLDPERQELRLMLSEARVAAGGGR